MDGLWREGGQFDLRRFRRLTWPGQQANRQMPSRPQTVDLSEKLQLTTRQDTELQLEVSNAIL